MRRLLNWIVGVPAALIVVGFAIANRDWTRVSFDPFSRDAPFVSAAMPLWALLFCGLFLGAIVGWIVCWLGQSKWRRAAREARAETERLRAEAAAARAAGAPEPPRIPAMTGHEPF